MRETQECQHCGASFISRSTQPVKFCSKKCRNGAHKKSQGIFPEFPTLDRNTVGALNELRVAVDLMARGYEVFRALSPSASCDVIAVKDESLLRIEIRTGVQNKNGTLGYPQRKNQIVEQFAIVLPTGIIHYVPGLK